MGDMKKLLTRFVFKIALFLFNLQLLRQRVGGDRFLILGFASERVLLKRLLRSWSWCYPWGKIQKFSYPVL